MAQNRNNNTHQSPFPMVIDKIENHVHHFKPPRVITKVSTNKNQKNEELKLQDNGKYGNVNYDDNARHVTFSQTQEELYKNNNNFYIKVYVAAKSPIVYQINGTTANDIALQYNVITSKDLHTIREKSVETLGLFPHVFLWETPTLCQFNNKITHSEIQQTLDRLNTDINRHIKDALWSTKKVKVKPYVELYLYDLANKCKSYKKVLVSLNNLNELDNVNEGNLYKIYNMNIGQIQNDQLIKWTFNVTPILQTQQYVIASNTRRNFYHWSCNYTSVLPCDLIGRFVEINEYTRNYGNSKIMLLSNLFGSLKASIQVDIRETTNQSFWKAIPDFTAGDVVIIKSVQINDEMPTKVSTNSDNIQSKTYYCYTDFTTEFVLARDFAVDIQNQHVQKGFKAAMANAAQ
eukprot:76440_1